MPRDETYLLYMLLAARRVVKSIADISRDAFDANSEKMDSVVLQLGNIGEAANQISEDFKQRHHEVPWHKMIGMRHRMFHAYHKIDWDVVWDSAHNDCPKLIQVLEPLVPPEEEA